MNEPMLRNHLCEDTKREIVQHEGQLFCPWDDWNNKRLKESL